MDKQKLQNGQLWKKQIAFKSTNAGKKHLIYEYLLSTLNTITARQCNKTQQ